MPISINANVEISSFWTEFKSNAITTNKSLTIQYNDDGAVYTIFAFDSEIVYLCNIWKGTIPDSAVSAGYSQIQNDSDKLDFENNYKSIANVRITNITNQVSILSNATITTSGNGFITGITNNQINLIINIKNAPTGTGPGLQFTLQEIDPGDLSTNIGSSITGTVINSSGTQEISLDPITSGAVKISWVISGTSLPTFTGVYVTLSPKNSETVTANIGTTNGLALDTTLTGGTTKTQIYDGTNVIGTSSHPVRIDPIGTTTQPISGTVTANAGSGTFTVGGIVTSNIGTTGGLALDSSVNGLLLSQGSTTSGEKGSLIQGAVTTSAPTYTNAQTNPLSLTTSGALRIDGSTTTQPISGVVTANIGTTGGLALDSSVNGILVAQGSTTSGETGPLIQGAVTTSAPSYTTAQTRPLSLTTTGLLRVDGSGVTQPISGTVTANAGSGTFTISGTVTSNIGTTGGLALDTSVNGILLSQGSTTSGEKGSLIQGAVTTSAPTYTTGQTNPLSLTTAGSLRVDGSGTTQPISGTVTSNQGTAASVSSGWPVKITDGVDTIGISTVGGAKALKVDVIQSVGGSGGTSSSFGSSFPASGTASGFTDGTNMQGARVFDADSGAGTEYVVGVNLRGSNSGGSFELGTSSHPVKIDPTGTTIQPVNGTVTSNIGTTGGLALDTSVNGILLAQGSTTSGQTGTLIQGAVTTSAPSYTTAKTNPLSLTTSGLLRVDGSGVTQPISGTITANAGSGTFTINGTVTANIGTTNGLALDTSVNGILLSQGSTTSGEKGPLIQGAVTTSAPTYSTAQTSPLSLTTSGLLRVDGSGVTQPVSGTVTSNQGAANTLSNKWPVQITDGTNTMPTGDTVGRAIFEKITDGTNTAAVKAASTPAAATDPSLVVAISPNNSITVAPSSGVPDITASGTLGALNATVQVSLSGQRGASMQLLSGTLVGTIVPELSTDGGTTWNNTYFYDCESSIYAPNIAFPSNNTSITRNIVIISGASHIRIRVSAYGSGSATCNVRSSSTNNDRIFRTSISGRSLNDSSKSILLNDSSSTLNTALWTLTKLGTGTATGLVLTNDTTSTHYVIITSNHQFYSTPSDPLIVCFTASMFAATNGIIDFGIGSPVSLPSAGLQFGAYFQIDGSGNITANLAYTGQAKFANMGTYSASSFFYKWCIEIIDYGVKFFIEDFNGNVLSNVILSSPDGNGLASPYPLLGFGTFPIYARVYNIGTAGSTPEFNGTAISVYRLDTGTNKDWPSQMAATSRWFNINPTTFAQNAQLAAGAAPATKTPASTTSAYATLGGEFVLQNTASSENLLGVFDYQIPSPFTFYLTNILFPPPVVTTALGATVEIQEWCLMVANSANPSTATGFRNSLGLYSAAASAVAGTVFNGQTINPTFTTPIVVYPGQFLLILVKVISGSTTGVYRGSILLNGYFE